MINFETWADDIEGTGRSELEARVRVLVRELRTANVNLESIRLRCTELTEENRRLRSQSPGI
jgi:DNA-binding response OmpR family regulator